MDKKIAVGISGRYFFRGILPHVVDQYVWVLRRIKREIRCLDGRIIDKIRDAVSVDAVLGVIEFQALQAVCLMLHENTELLKGGGLGRNQIHNFLQAAALVLQADVFDP